MRLSRGRSRSWSSPCRGSWSRSRGSRRRRWTLRSSSRLDHPSWFLWLWRSGRHATNTCKTLVVTCTIALLVPFNHPRRFCWFSRWWSLNVAAATDCTRGSLRHHPGRLRRLVCGRLSTAIAATLASSTTFSTRRNLLHPRRLLGLGLGRLRRHESRTGRAVRRFFRHCLLLSSHLREHVHSPATKQRPCNPLWGDTRSLCATCSRIPSTPSTPCTPCAGSDGSDVRSACVTGYSLLQLLTCSDGTEQITTATSIAAAFRLARAFWSEGRRWGWWWWRRWWWWWWWWWWHRSRAHEANLPCGAQEVLPIEQVPRPTTQRWICAAAVQRPFGQHNWSNPGACCARELLGS